MLHDLPLGDPVARGLAILLGAALLVAGRRLFWLAVAALGFLLGYLVAGALLSGAGGTAQLALSLVAGAAGAFLAIAVQKVAVAFAGFALALLAAAELAPHFGVAGGATYVLVLMVAGVVGALLAIGLFGLAVTVVTAGVGAALVTAALPLGHTLHLVLLAVLWVAGVLLQRR